MDFTDEELARIEAQERGRELAMSMARSRLARAEKVYDYSVTSVWIANAGAAVSVLAFLGSTWNGGEFPRQLLWPLGFFMTGLISLGLGTVILLVREVRGISRLERTNSLMDLHTADIKMLGESAGLSLRDPRTLSALISGLLFVGGCLVGFILLAAS